MASVDTPPALVNPPDPVSWAEVTCRELLVIQGQNRQLAAEQRAEAVELHLRQRIAMVPDAKRRACLRALSARFPLPESGASRVTPEPAPLSAEQWVASFDSIKGGLTPELKQALVEKLRAAGCLPTSVMAATTGNGVPVPPTVEPLLPKGAADMERVAQLLDVIFEASRALDGNFRRVWEGVADFGKTDHGLPRMAFEDITRKFLAGDEEVPRVVLKTRVETITKLIPVVLISVKESWDAMEADVANCLPDEVQKRVKKGAFGYEASCWKEFTKGAQKLHPDLRVQQFFGQIVSKARAHIPR